MELLLNLLKWSMIVGSAALALTLLKPLLDKRYSAKWRYGAWLVMAVFLLLAPVRLGAAAPQVPVSPAVVIEVPKVEVAVSQEGGVSFQRPETAAKPAVKSPAASVTTKPAVKSKTFPLEELLTTLWATGGALFLLYHTLGTWYFTRRAKRWSRTADEETQRVFTAVCRDMALKNPPALRISTAVDSPMMVGLFRPTLLLPSEDFDELELAFILRHELTHHRRHDLWYKLLLTLANTLHWFNPLVYLLRLEAERDLELTCDDAVVAGTDTDVRRAYSETLLASIHRQKGLGRAVLSTHFYGGKEVMKERFRNILGKRGRKRGIFVLVVVLAATIAAACAFGLQPTTDGALSEEELAEWEEKVNNWDELDQYLWCMYTDPSKIPSEECLEREKDTRRRIGYYQERERPTKVLSGTRTGDTVTLELRGDFLTGLTTGTLTLVDGEPVSFTNPLYTAVETAAYEFMDMMAETYIAESEEYGPGGLKFTEKYITTLACSQPMQFDGKTYQVWDLFYLMKANDYEKIVLTGGMYGKHGWLGEGQSAGRPFFITSVDEDGNIVVEEQTFSSTTFETGLTWEEYVYFRIHLGMDWIYGGVLNGWPEWDTAFLEDLRDGHNTGYLEWDDTVLSYLNQVYGITPDSGFTVLRAFNANEVYADHDQSMVVKTTCGGRTFTLFLARAYYPVEAWGTTFRFWQVVAEKWEPDAPPKDGPYYAEEPYVEPLGKLMADELIALNSYFNVVEHNGLLRVPYKEFGDTIPYMEFILYDMGRGGLSGVEERQAVVDAFFDGTDPECDISKMTRETIRNFFERNFPVNMTDADFEYYWDQMKERMLYLEDYDAFYLVHGDTMMSGYSFDRAEWNDDYTVSAYYTTDLWQYDNNGELELHWDQPMCATLQPIENYYGSRNWKVISNTIAE